MTQSLLRSFAFIVFFVLAPGLALAQPPAATAGGASEAQEYRIAPGDIIRVTVFKSPDLTLETRVEDNGTISYPLIGIVAVGGSSISAAEQLIASKLRDGGFIVSPHVTITVVEVRGNMVTVLGQVGKPGRFPLDSTNSKLSDMIALAGGISQTGSDVVVLTGVRDGRPIRREVDILDLANAGDPSSNVRLLPGDMLYVNRAPTFYIYGEVQKPGSYRLERTMTVMQALATGGGLTPKGTQRGLTIHRRAGNGAVTVIEPRLDDSILENDVLYVRESIF